MSFNISLNNAIDTIISSYISKISEKYNIDKTELQHMWNNKNTVSEVSSEVKSSSSNLDKDNLQKLTKNDLVNICKEKKIKHTGTKPELIDRLLEHKNKVIVEKTKSISEKIQTTLETIQIRKNKFGNYEHFETRIVFDKNNQNAIGTQNSNGKIDTLTQEDIEQCKKFKFKFQLPSNITSKKSSQPSKIQDETIDEDNISDIEKEEKEDKEEEIIIEDDGDGDGDEDEDDEELDLDDDVEEVYESD